MPSTELADEHTKQEATTSLTQDGSTEIGEAKPEVDYPSGLPFFLVVFALLLSMFLVREAEYPYHNVQADRVQL